MLGSPPAEVNATGPGRRPLSRRELVRVGTRSVAGPAGRGGWRRVGAWLGPPLHRRQGAESPSPPGHRYGHNFSTRTPGVLGTSDVVSTTTSHGGQGTGQGQETCGGSRPNLPRVRVKKLCPYLCPGGEGNQIRLRLVSNAMVNRARARRSVDRSGSRDCPRRQATLTGSPRPINVRRRGEDLAAEDAV